MFPSAGTRARQPRPRRGAALEPPIRQGVFIPKRDSGGCDTVSVLGDSAVRTDESVVRSFRNQARPAVNCRGAMNCRGNVLHCGATLPRHRDDILNIPICRMSHHEASSTQPDCERTGKGRIRAPRAQDVQIAPSCPDLFRAFTPFFLKSVEARRGWPGQRARP